MVGEGRASLWCRVPAPDGHTPAPTGPPLSQLCPRMESHRRAAQRQTAGPHGAAGCKPQLQVSVAWFLVRTLLLACCVLTWPLPGARGAVVRRPGVSLPLRGLPASRMRPPPRGLAEPPSPLKAPSLRPVTSGSGISLQTVGRTSAHDKGVGLP